MRDETRSRRQEEIEKAAYEVLEEKGYSGTSMLGVARRARASNETLYNWYGDKQGLFKALVMRNADEVRLLLELELASGQAPLKTLERLGPKLLSLLLGNRAVALNRAAAADPSGELGETISTAGRETVMPLIQRVLEDARERGQLAFGDPGETAALFLDLLVGDLQIRRVIGRLPEPSAEFCQQRAGQALARFARLLA